MGQIVLKRNNKKDPLFPLIRKGYISYLSKRPEYYQNKRMVNPVNNMCASVRLWDTKSLIQVEFETESNKFIPFYKPKRKDHRVYNLSKYL